jgi:hypothetical protein
MNQFSTINAQDSLSSLIQVASNEATQDNVQPIAERKSKINIAKLVLWNMAQPFSKRIALADLQNKLACAAHRGKLASLREQIRLEVAADLKKLRDDEENLMSL